MRKAKIVCTIGPASSSPEMLQHLIEAPFTRLISYHLGAQLAASALAMILGFAALAVLACFFAHAYRALAPAGAAQADMAPSGALSAR